MIKLITCDIDGTLLKKYTDKIDHKIFYLIERFHEKGVLFVAASGRQLYNLKLIFEPVKDKIGYIAENGALVSYNDELIFKSKIEKELAKSLSQKIIEKEDLEVFICSENTTYVIPKSNEFSKYVESEVVNHITIVNSIDDIEQDILKVSMFCKGGINEEIVAIFKKDFGEKFQHTISGNTWYDFMNFNIHKGNAIKILQDLINVTKEETVSFGDNFNDIEMLSDAKYSYAMEDAHKDVKKVANFTCTNVADTLEELYERFFGK